MKTHFNYCRNKKLRVMSILFLSILLISYRTISKGKTIDVLLMSLLSLMIIVEIFSVYSKRIIGERDDMVLLPRHFTGLGSMYFGNITKIKIDQLKSIRIEVTGNKKKILVEYLDINKEKISTLYKCNFKNKDSEEFINFIQQEILTKISSTRG